MIYSGRIATIFLSFDKAVYTFHCIINFKAVYVKHLNLRDKKCNYKRMFSRDFRL